MKRPVLRSTVAAGSWLACLVFLCAAGLPLRAAPAGEAAAPAPVCRVSRTFYTASGRWAVRSEGLLPYVY